MPSLLGFCHDVQGSHKVAKIAHLHLRLSNKILVHWYSSRPSLWGYFTVRRAKNCTSDCSEKALAHLSSKSIWDITHVRSTICARRAACHTCCLIHVFFFYTGSITKCFRREICKCVHTVMCLFLDLRQNSFPSLCGIHMHKHSQMRCQHNTYP